MVSLAHESAPALLTARWVLPVSHPPIAHGFVTYHQGIIRAVGRVAELPADQQAAYDPMNPRLLTPGLINTHTHLELTWPTMISAEGGMGAWLQRVVQQQQADTDDDRRQRIRRGIQQCLAAGVTTVNDISSRGECLPWLSQAGLRAMVSLEYFHPGVHTASSMHPLWQRLDPLWEALHGLAYPPLCQLGLSPHSAYNVHPTAWQAAIDRYQPAFIHTHGAESHDETRWLQGPCNAIDENVKDNPIDRLHRQVLGQSFEPAIVGCSTTVSYWQQTGVMALAIPVRMAHGVYCTERDRQALAQAGWSVLHCPRSNIHLQGETLKWREWQSQHPLIAIGLGTDSTLSSPDLDLRAEARLAARLHGWSAKEALAITTLEGAGALGIGATTGSLQPGLAADMVVWQTHPALRPNHTPETLWLQPETQAKTCIIAGDDRTFF